MDISYPEPHFPEGIQIYVSQPAITPESSSSVINAMKNSALSSKSEHNILFEQNLKSFFQVPTACSISNGYTALYVILKSLKDIESQKNQIIIPDATMIAVANAVIDNGFKPILVDNQENQVNPSAHSFISKISKNTKAIIVTHTYGVPVQHFQILVQYAFQNDIYLIEDIAEAIGVKYKDKYLGSYGHFASASLYANKLITAGDGGFIISKLTHISNSQSLQKQWKCLINHGFSTNYHFNHTVQTGNYRINGLGAAFVCNFHKYILKFIEKRKIIDKIYRKLLTNSQKYILMQNNSNGQNVPWVFYLKLKDKETLKKIRQHLANYGIETRPFFKPIHTQPFMNNIIGQFKNAIIQYETGFYLPTYHQLTEQMQIYICDVLNSYFNTHNEVKRKSFEKKQKKILDLLSSDQIYEVIKEMSEAIKYQQLNLFITQKTIPLLKQLYKQLKNSEIIQINQCSKGIKYQQQNNSYFSQENKTILIRKNQKDFGKKNISFKPVIIEYLNKYNHHYQKYFKIQKKSAQQLILWQKQYDKQRSIQQLSSVQFNQKWMTIAQLIARQIYGFHSISSSIVNTNENYFSLQFSLSDELIQVFSLLTGRLQKLSAFKELMKVINVIFDIIMSVNKQNQISQIRLISNNITLENIVYFQEQQAQVVHLFDFEHIGFNEVLKDLAFIDDQYRFIKLSKLVLQQYLNLSQLKISKQTAINRVKIHQANKIIKQILFKASNSKHLDVQLREFIRIKVDQIFKLFEKTIQQKQLNIYQAYIKENYDLVHFHKQIDRKFQLKNKTSWEHHYGGWKYFQKKIYEYLNSNHSEIIFCSAIEKSFYDNIIIDPIKDKWCGFIHSVALKGQYNCANLEYIFENLTFLQSLKNCKGLYCLTEYNKKKIQQNFPTIPCENITYPFTPNEKLFKQSILEESNQLNILHIGQYLRNVNFFINLKIKVSQFKKIIIQCGEIVKNSDQDHIQWIQQLPGQKYQDLLTTSVVFLNLIEAGGCTTVIECISRNTPIIINRLESLEEYLGKSYPLFYESVEQAEAIFSNNFIQKAKQAHYYLLNKNKQKFYLQTAIQSLHDGYIYQMLKMPNQQKNDFQQYDVSILLISYKRQYNLKKIVSLLSQQSYRGTIEIIIWNNNPNYSLSFLQQQFRNKFAKIVVIESTCNYYCYVRAAIASLARGKYLMFCDDDIFPNEEFVSIYLNCFETLQQKHKKQQIVACLKGNVFHNFHPKNDIKFWINYDNIHFISPKDPEQQLDIIHMDTCLMKKQLMIKCASFEIPELDYILVDDYWFSFVLSYHLNAKIYKINPTNPIFQQCPSSQDSSIALCMQSSVIKQKNRFFCYHSNFSWPSILQKENFSKLHNTLEDKQLLQKLILKEQKSKQFCMKVYRQQFSGYNISSTIWNKSLHPLVFEFKCNVVRIGVVDLEKQFLSFYLTDGIHISKQQDITNKLIKLDTQLSELEIKYIITMGNIPGQNQYYRQNNSAAKKPWFCEEYLRQLYKLWQIIARVLVKCTNCIGYDLINQPKKRETLSQLKLVEIYQTLINYIRQIDDKTPIILQPIGGSYDNLANLIDHFNLHNDVDNIIFSFHFYDPYVWTSGKNKKNEQFYQYPGPIPEESGVQTSWSKNTKMWDKEIIHSIFKDINELKTKYQLKDQQLLLGQYGCRYDRKGIQQYFSDICATCSFFKINRMVYAYREQWWAKMNYEYKPTALDVIKKDISSFRKNISMKHHLFQFKSTRSKETPWTSYNPFYFQIQENTQKKSNLRKKIVLTQMSQLRNEQLSPIFIVGCGRSGTTFLLKCLSFADNFLNLHQPLLIWLEVFPEFNIWTKQKNQILEVKESFYDQNKVRVDKIKNIYHLLLEETKKQILVDKQPQNVFKLYFLKKCFPKMKIIYMERDQTEVINSIQKFSTQDWYGQQKIKFEIIYREARQKGEHYEKDSSSNLTMAKIEWKQSKKAFNNFKENQHQNYLKNHVFEINFDQLMKQTHRVIRQLCNFLKVPQHIANIIIKGALNIKIVK